ncbi:Hypothetical predicted protein [Octopus vulgaris]|uniref:Uncharacterized protein n=1 Tax=Octopus vulgaris TaxID=6645 RepID=A0AA36BBA1_OCTVU|nr:Hypothetical predicted protein [Octopus vulgaris]
MKLSYHNKTYSKSGFENHDDGIWELRCGENYWNLRLLGYSPILHKYRKYLPFRIFQLHVIALHKIQMTGFTPNVLMLLQIR